MKKKCLLDTGSQVSIWPTSPSSKHTLSNVWLSASNGTPIKVLGRQSREIHIGEKSYSFVFYIAQVSRPILGIDFLQKFGMVLDLGHRRLLHSGSSTRFSSVTSRISGINVVHVPHSPFTRLLLDFPEVTDTALASRTSRHGVECYINTTGPPVSTAPRQLSPDKLRVAKDYFDVMWAARICRRSDSPWSSGLHMVLKKECTWRPCGDYRCLNGRMTNDAYPLLHIHDFAAGLSGKTIFSKIDLVKGYHHVRAEDVPKTAIATPFGLFEFVRMPFRLKTAAQTFQRLMDNVTSWLEGVFVYLDDVLVASTSPAQHEKDLKQLFDTLKRFGLVLNVSKCIFGVSQLEFLGLTVSARGISLPPSKFQAVQRFEQPQTVKSLQRFLGLVNFYRRFLPRIAATMRLLTDALAGAPRQLHWTKAMTSSFQLTKKRLAEATLLFHPVPDSELQINTDASSRAIAGTIQ